MKPGRMKFIGKCHHLQLARTCGLVDWSQKRLNRTVRFWDERKPGRRRLNGDFRHTALLIASSESELAISRAVCRKSPCIGTALQA